MGRQAQTLVVKPQYYQNILDALPIDSSVNTSNYLYEGDLTELTTSDGVAPLSSGAMSAAVVAAIGRFIGISGTTAPTQYWNNKMPDSAQVYLSGVANLYQTAGDTYKVGDEVTVGADAQTITSCSNYAGPAATGASASGTGGTWTAAAHTLQATFLTSIGETSPGTSASVSPTAGQNIVTPAVSVPSWAVGVCWYVDGLFAGFASSGSAQTLAGPNTNPRVIPVSNCLAIGRIVPAEDKPISQNYVSGITGVAGKFIRVRFKNVYPFDRVRVA